eukprot:3565442-Amphidinium_carterae.1
MALQVLHLQEVHVTEQLDDTTSQAAKRRYPHLAFRAAEVPHDLDGLLEEFSFNKVMCGTCVKYAGTNCSCGQVGP